MNLVEITDKADWDNYLSEYSKVSFQQSWEWGEFRKLIGYSVLRLGLFDDSSRIKLLLSLESRSLPMFTGNVWYVPRFQLAGGKNKRQELIKKFVELFTQKYNGTFLRIMPDWSETEDIDWKDMGFKDPEVLLNQHEVGVTWLTSLVISEEELLKNMHQKTRYNINLAKRKRVIVKQQDKNIGKFYKLIKHTGSKQKIKVFSQNYYDKLFNLASKFLVVEVFTAVYKNSEIATAMVVGYKDTLTYLYGGSSVKYKEVMAPYLLHWEVMKWAKQKGYRQYDWWGIERNYGQKESVKKVNSSLAGVTRFKKGFGGSEFIFSGTHDYKYNIKQYKLLKLYKKFRSILNILFSSIRDMRK